MVIKALFLKWELDASRERLVLEYALFLWFFISTLILTTVYSHSAHVFPSKVL